MVQIKKGHLMRQLREADTVTPCRPASLSVCDSDQPSFLFSKNSLYSKYG